MPQFFSHSLIILILLTFPLLTQGVIRFRTLSEFFSAIKFPVALIFLIEGIFLFFLALFFFERKSLKKSSLKLKLLGSILFGILLSFIITLSFSLAILLSLLFAPPPILIYLFFVTFGTFLIQIAIPRAFLFSNQWKLAGRLIIFLIPLINVLLLLFGLASAQNERIIINHEFPPSPTPQEILAKELPFFIIGLILTIFLAFFFRFLLLKFGKNYARKLNYP